MAVVIAMVSAGQAEIIHVDDDNCPGPGSGTAGDPYCSIQIAINSAVDGVEIVVAPGTYFESINFLGKAITVRSSHGPQITIIDAGGSQGAGSVVVCNSGEGSDTVLEGFTVTGGLAGAGGGMRNDGTSPTVIDCVFSNNVAGGAGGGMSNLNGSPTVLDCTFDGNFVTLFIGGGAGGGIYNKNSSPTVIGCTFRENTVLFFLGAGGGIFNDSSHPIIMNCLFHGNLASDGSAMLNHLSDPTVTNCTLTGNAGGTAIVNGSSNPVLTNCILWANDSGQIFDHPPSSSSTVTYSDVEGGWPGAGNIDADPLFVRASNCCVLHLGTGCDDPVCELAVCAAEPSCCDVFWDALCADLAATLCPGCPGDLSLSPGSPCIDAGDNAAVPEEIETDLDGNPRLLDVPEMPDAGNGEPPVVDMGAYESLGGGCLALTGQEVVCHPDGSTFTLSIAGLSACTGGTVAATFTASGGDVGEDLCFTMMVNDEQGGFCCSTQLCAPVPDCSQATADLDGDGLVGILDLLLLLAQFGTCQGPCWADMDHDGAVGVTDLLVLLSNWD